MTKIGLTVIYDGTQYCGWQIQPNGVTVQETIQNAIEKVTGEKVNLTGSGRTDAGVHAEGQFAHFETNSAVPPEKFFKAINVHLPEDIRVQKSQLLPDDFHAVKSAKKKTYKYSVYTGETENPVIDRFATYLPQSPDFKLMKKCAKLFVGEHDFKGFSATGGSAKTSVRTIYKIRLVKKSERTDIYITGNGFLYKMVRMIVGTIVQAGLKKVDFLEIKTSLKTGEKPKNQQTMPAKGLCLVKVEYSELNK